MHITVVAPTYCEAENVEWFLRAVRAALPDAHVLVVDDASPDGTATIARQVGAELGGVEVVDRAAKTGLGDAYRHGFELALARSCDVVVSMDVDRSHDPVALPGLVAAIEDGADLAIGSRYVEGGRIADWPLHRRLLSSWGNRYTSFVLGLGVRDCTSAYRAHRASALTRLDLASTSAQGYAFLTEVVRRAVAVGMTVVEVPIVFVDREFGHSKMSWRIVVESMFRVTRWGVRDRTARRRQPG